jgi:hypothetical protein
VILQCFLSKHKILVSHQVININRYLHNIRSQLSYLVFTHVYVGKCIALDETMVLVWKFHNLPKNFLDLKCLCLVQNNTFNLECFLPLSNIHDIYVCHKV